MHEAASPPSLLLRPYGSTQRALLDSASFQDRPAAAVPFPHPLDGGGTFSQPTRRPCRTLMLSDSIDALISFELQLKES